MCALRQPGATRPNPQSITQRIFGEGELFDGTAFDQMLLNYSFQNFRRNGVIPDSFRIDDGDRTLLANAEAVGLRAEDAVFTFRDSEFFEAALEVVPGFNGYFSFRAFRFRLVGA